MTDDLRFRIWLVRAAMAVWGLAAAIGAMPRLQGKAADDTLPGAMQAAGLDPAGPVLQFALLITVPLLVVLTAQRVAPLVVQRSWVTWSFAGVLMTAPVTLMHYGTLRHVVMHGLLGAAIVVARRLEPRFSRSDVLLVPCALAFYFAFLDTGFGKTPAATFFRAGSALLILRLAAGAISNQRRPAIAFSAAPAAFLFQLQWLEPVVAGTLALIWLIGTPLLLARVDERRLIRIAARTAFPLAAAAYPLALAGIDTPPLLDFFEDGHSLLPASEMARGELPYRDVVPMHGFLTDGGLDLAAMKTIEPTLGAILTSRRVLAALTGTAIYLTTLALTTSAELALLSTFLSLAMFPAASIWPRAVLPLFALACAAAGTRLRRTRWFAGAGALSIASALMSLDLALCSLVVTAFGAVRAGAWKPFTIGAAVTTAAILAAFAIVGVLPDFLHATFFEVLASGDVYLIAPLELPHGLRTLAEIAGGLSHAEAFGGVTWFVALIGASLALARSPWKGNRRDALWLVAGWIVLAAGAWVTRRHYYFTFALAPFLVGGLLAVRRHSRTAAIALTIALVFFAKPFSLVFDISSPLRRAGGLGAEGWREYDALPRARGALVDPLTHEALGTAQRFITTRLRPDETFYDFANAASLYYLFDKPCPIRYLEVPLYEQEERQRDVIATLERDRTVRAALIAFPTAYTAIDGVWSKERAPLVWQYLQANFEPAFDEHGVVFWIRRDV